MENGKRLKNRRLLIIGCMIAGLLAGMASSAFAKGNQVFFRGGGAFLSADRGNQVFTDAFGATGTFNNEDSGYYVGGGVELVLSNDVWGFIPKTTVLGEIGVEYRRFDSKKVAQAVPTTCALAAGGTPYEGICDANLNAKVQLTMLNVSVSPKIKFNEGSALRPWIIPVGLDFIVISPPSNDTTYLDVGVQFAGGLEYNIYGPFNVGADVRYHLSARHTDTNNDVTTVGAYFGIDF
jgi:hypothetical protein